jgi:hypothetical protein
MFTLRTEAIIENAAHSIYGAELPGIEHVHLRGAMFGYYKAGSGATIINGRWQDKGLQLIKPGKFIKMINKDMSDDKVERMVNRIKSYVSTFGDEHGEGIEAPFFSVASGEMIGHYYLDKNYAESDGNLGNSCMRRPECQPYFKLYEQNQDAVSMLVLRNSEHIIVARALLWFDGTDTYMDTIYRIADKFETSMIEYACRHGIYYKRQQSCHYFAFDMFNREKIEPKILNIHIDKVDVVKWEFPWLDTLMYMYMNSGKYYLTNCPTPGINGTILQLRSTSGSIYDHNINDDRLLHMETAFTLLYGGKRSPSVTKFLEDREALVEAVEGDENSIVSNWNGSFLATIIKEPKDIPLGYKRLFINNQPEEGQVEINGEFYDEDDCVIDIHGNWVHIDDAVEVDGDWYHHEDGRIRYSEHYGRHYHEDDVTYVESRDDYYPNDDTVWDEYTNENILERYAVYVQDYGYIHEDDVHEVAVEVNGEYHKTERCFQCEITDEWYLNDEKCELPDGRVVCQEAYDEWIEENDTDEQEVEEEQP